MLCFVSQQVPVTSSSKPMDAKAHVATGRRELVPTEDALGRTESLTLLMCAASVGNHEALSALLITGPADTCFDTL